MSSIPTPRAADIRSVEPCTACDTEPGRRCPACNSTGWMVLRRVELMVVAAP